uniref:WapI family immunity protein n=2 Tax=Virgisporangium aurantiacum TaxID=175570 RepID=UPI00194DBB23|nr:hypothetical protein [Virgisporangium aurantiacum]
MQLMGVAGHGVDVRVVGYQFPDADDPAKRFSWHMVEVSATCAEGSWTVSYPALTCDESPRLSRWLRNVADTVGSTPTGTNNTAVLPAVLSFVEPNLSLTVVRSAPATALIDIGLDLEFAPPWRSRHAAGDPCQIRCEVSRERLLQAAAEWDAEIALYPDR